jgi:hypothetical protein
MGSTHNTWSFCPDYICSPIQGVLPPHQSRQPAHLLPFSSFGDESDTPVHAVLQTHFPAFQVTLERPLLITSLTSGCGGTWVPSVSGLQKLKQLHFGSLAYKHRTRYVCAKKLLETTAGWITSKMCKGNEWEKSKCQTVCTWNSARQSEKCVHSTDQKRSCGGANSV